MNRTCTRCAAAKPISDFYANSAGKITSHCRVCVKEQRREYYLAHRAEKLLAAAEWKRANPGAVKRIAQLEAKRNKARKNATRQCFRRAHPHLVAEAAARARLKRHASTPRWANPKAIREIYDLCLQSSRAAGEAWHVDHIVPTNSPLVCGLHVEHNLQVIPGKMNQSKSNHFWPDMP